MASIESTPARNENEAWNEAYDRVSDFLSTLALGDRAYVSKVALDIVQTARQAHTKDPARDPVTLTMAEAQRRLVDWLATNLGDDDRAPSHILTTGYIAMLLSQVNRTAPTSFLAASLPEELRQALRETLIQTGPDLNVSSMSPRRLDYGPMLAIAQQTWHRWSAKEIVMALLFWTAIYLLFYWWLSPLV